MILVFCDIHNAMLIYNTFGSVQIFLFQMLNDES